MAELKTHRLPAGRCTACGAAADAATEAAPGGQRPKPGDVTVCLYCGHIMIFADDLSLRDPNDSEAHEIAGDQRIIRAVEAAHRRKGRRHG